MDRKEYRVAVASTDGIVVNQHFGKAGTFYIYQVQRQGSGNGDEDSTEICIRLLAKREVIPVCQGGNHDDNRMRKNIQQLAGCDYLLAQQAGIGACRMLQEQGIEVYQFPGMIEESIRQMDIQIQIQELFD